jgi:zinc transport system ATP-binding protein
VPKAQSKTPTLVVNDLAVTYPGMESPAVEGVSFELQPHTINILVGPNGSGKSTLLKAILGILPSTGEIKFSSSDISLYKQVGYVPQRLEFDLNLPITVYEFLRLTLVECTHSHNYKKKLIRQALKQVEAEHLNHKNFGDLSGGQRQRVILARALLHEPQLLILDEPEAGIDFKGEQLFYDVLKKLVTEKNVTALIASHEMEIVHQYADQVLCINHNLVCAGTPQKALTPQTLNQLYGIHKKVYQHHHHNH